MSYSSPFLLDVTRLIWRRWKGRLPTGIDRVALAYLDHFGPRSQAVVQHKRFRRILDQKASAELFALLRAPGASFKRDLVSGLIRNLAHLGAEGCHRLYLNVGHTGLNMHGLSNWVQKSDVRPIYLVHDLIPIAFPQFARAGENERHRDRIRTVLTTGSGVIANSRATFEELQAFASSEGLSLPPAIIAPLGIDPIACEPSNALSRPTFVTVGTIEARKNHITLLNVWSRLVARLGANAPRLVIIGQRGWEADEVFRRLDHDEGLRDHVVELARCSDHELSQHLKSARALLFPSFVEGYGLPLVEALAAGTPAIASKLPVFQELCGTLPLYLDPNDEDAWEAAIIDYSSDDSPSRQAQLRRMQSFIPPSWEQHFSIVENWLQALA